MCSRPSPPARPDPWPAARRLTAGLALAIGSAACAGSRPAVATDARFAPGDAGAVARARADSLRYPYTKADIDFMTGMIHHHAQAITISRWAPSHGASAELQRLTARIINAQADEIRLMQDWLRDRGQAVPAVDSVGTVTMPAAASTAEAHAGHDMAAHAGHAGHADHAVGGMTMPGMLTAAQLAELDAARGDEFDRLFLIYMIRHHQGAVTMVRDLFAQDGAGQDETIFKFAGDVQVDQGTEIQRMLTMLLERGHVLPPG